MSFIDSLLNVLAPHACLGCAREGTLLCYACLHRLPEPQAECYFCRQPMPNSLTCTSCMTRAGLHQVVVGSLYGGLVKQLVQCLKFGGAQAAIKPMVYHLSTLVCPANQVIMVPVPTASSRIRRRGYDQAALLARSLARQHGCQYLNCLQRLGNTHQVGANRRQRLAQLEGAVLVRRTNRFQGKTIVLVDDVITTGATFEAAARVMLAAGAAQVSALAYARGA